MKALRRAAAAATVTAAALTGGTALASAAHASPTLVGIAATPLSFSGVQATYPTGYRAEAVTYYPNAGHGYVQVGIRWTAQGWRYYDTVAGDNDAALNGTKDLGPVVPGPQTLGVGRLVGSIAIGYDLEYGRAPYTPSENVVVAVAAPGVLSTNMLTGPGSRIEVTWAPTSAGWSVQTSRWDLRGGTFTGGGPGAQPIPLYAVTGWRLAFT